MNGRYQKKRPKKKPQRSPEGSKNPPRSRREKQMDKNSPIKLQPFCTKHSAELIRRAGYARTDPWFALLLAAQVAMFQGATSTESVHKKTGGDIYQIAAFGCLACRLPIKWEDLLQITRTAPKDLGAIKNLGETWVKEESG
jgi:hypothetical protein